MKKVKILKVSMMDMGYDYYEPFLAPIITQISDWEEIEDSELEILKQAVRNRKTEDGYKLVLLEYNNEPAKLLIKEEIDRINKWKIHLKKEEEDRRKKIEQDKIKRLLKQKEKDEKKIRELAAKHGINIPE